MNKEKGIIFLTEYELPTVALIPYDSVMSEYYIIKKGLSVRLSSNDSNNIDVDLPSIHNCLDKDKIKKFVDQYKSHYNILIHETVVPDIIGSISKYHISSGNILVIETYENFEQRKKQIVKDRLIFRQYGNYFFKEDNDCSNEKQLLNLVNYIKIIPYESFNMEFVIEGGNILFTDFYSDEVDKIKRL